MKKIKLIIKYIHNRFCWTILFFSAIVTTVYSNADEDENISFPGGCRETGFSIKHQALMLQPHAAGGSHSIYFMYNKTNKNVKLYQMLSSDKPYVMHLNNTITTKQWGVYASDELEPKFICTINNGSTYGEIADCGQVLAICEYTNVKFAVNNNGNYWAVSSNSKRGAINTVRRQGILLRW